MKSFQCKELCNLLWVEFDCSMFGSCGDMMVEV
jgi:hypothetical protein